MKALTIRQPWASLIAVGAKSIETRSWSTTYRGPLVIHAGASAKTFNDLEAPSLMSERATIQAVYAALPGVQLDEGSWCSPFVVTGWEGTEDYIGFSGLDIKLPLGAVVASCQLADVVPIVGQHEEAESFGGPYVSVTGDNAFLWQDYDEEPHTETLADFMGQVPFGDFTPGRYAWLLEDVKPTTERCPACWGRGYDGFYRACVRGEWIDDAPHRCPVCDTREVCDPIPAKGRQGLWTWEPNALGVLQTVTHTGRA